MNHWVIVVIVSLFGIGMVFHAERLETRLAENRVLLAEVEERVQAAIMRNNRNEHTLLKAYSACAEFCQINSDVNGISSEKCMTLLGWELGSDKQK